MADKVNKEESISRVYQFLNSHKNWKEDADLNGDKTIIKTEFRTYLLGSNFKWNADENKNDVISAFWNSIDVNTSGTIGGGSKVSNQNALDGKELNKIDNNLLASSVVSDFMNANNIAAPSGSAGISTKYQTKWKESVKAGILNQVIEYLRNYNEKFETKEDLKAYLGDKLAEFCQKSSAKATADYKALDKMDELSSQFKNTNIDYKPQSDDTLGGIIDAYISSDGITEKQPNQITSDINTIVNAYIVLADDNANNDNAALAILQQFDSTIGDSLNPLQIAVLTAKFKDAVANDLKVTNAEFYNNNTDAINVAIATYVEKELTTSSDDFNTIVKNLNNHVKAFKDSQLTKLEADYNQLISDRNNFIINKVMVEWNKSEHQTERQNAIKTLFGKDNFEDIKKVIQSYNRAELDAMISKFDAAMQQLEADLVAAEEAAKKAAEEKYKASFGNLAGLIDDIMTDKLSSMLCGYGEIHTEFGVDTSGNIVFQEESTKEVYDKVQYTVKQQLKLKDKEACEAIGDAKLTKLIQSAWIMTYNTFNSSQKNSTAGFVQSVLTNLESILNSLKANPDYIDVYTSRTAYANTKLTSGLVHYNTNTTVGNDEIINYSGDSSNNGNTYSYVDGKWVVTNTTSTSTGDSINTDADGTVHIANTTDDPDYQATMSALLKKIKKTEPYTKVSEDILTRVFQEAQKLAIKTCQGDINDCPYGTGNNNHFVEDTTRDWGGNDSRDEDGFEITMKELVQITLYYFDKLLYKELANV